MSISWTDAVVALVVVLVVIVLLWPTEVSGTALLRKRGLLRPSADQVATAVDYLKARRLLYPVTVLAVPGLLQAAAALFDWTWSYPPVAIAWQILLALVVAELIAVLRPIRQGVRTAVLARRSWSSMVPRWAVWVFAAMVVLTVALSALWLLTENQVDPRVVADSEQPWLVLAGAIALAAMVFGTVWAAIARRPRGDLVVDAILRERSARVALGLGVLAIAPILNEAVQLIQRVGSLSYEDQRVPPVLDTVADWTGWVGLVALLASFATFIWTAIPNGLEAGKTTASA